MLKSKAKLKMAIWSAIIRSINKHVIDLGGLLLNIKFGDIYGRPEHPKK